MMHNGIRYGKRARTLGSGSLLLRQSSSRYSHSWPSSDLRESADTHKRSGTIPLPQIRLASQPGDPGLKVFALASLAVLPPFGTAVRRPDATSRRREQSLSDRPVKIRSVCSCKNEGTHLRMGLFVTGPSALRAMMREFFPGSTLSRPSELP